MPAPSTVAEFLALVRQSGLTDEAALSHYLQWERASVAQADTAGKLAGLLVRARLLTPFQAERLLRGQWRGFFLGRYTVLDQIGAGGMGAVYLCEHRHMKRRVAIKVLPNSLAKDRSCVLRFQREARALAALDHPNVVRAYDYGEDQGLHFLALEYVEGNSLQEMIKARGPLSPLQAIHYMRQAAAGLQHAFEAGLIHRDVKPSNLVVDLSGTVKVLDLGLARFYTDDKDNLSVINEDTVLGTIDYLAPESAVSGRLADIRSDIYGLGCTFYFCLTGQAPFPEGSMAEKVLAHQTRSPRPIRDLRPDVPRELTAIIDKMMAKKPKQRYQTPEELMHVLTRLLVASGETAVGGMDATLKESSRWKTRRRELQRWRRRTLAIGLTLLAGGLSALYFVLRLVLGKYLADRPARSEAPKPPRRVPDTDADVQL